MPKDHGIGASVKRREDIRFLTGTGHYTDDTALHGQTWAVFVRSNVAHGRIVKVGVEAAEGMPGVLAVFTGEDFVAVGGNPAGWLINSRDGTPMREPKRPVLAHGKVRHVGDAYAAVVAETYNEAKDAAQAIADASQIDELPAVVDMAAALANPANRVHDEIPDNQCFDWGWIEDNRQKVDDAIKAAPHVTTLELINNRLVPNAMEPRSSIGEFYPGTGDYKLTTTSQNPHLTRLLIAAFVLGIPENKLTVVAPDVGGGFGSKIYHYGEEALVLAAAKKLKRPVRWTADRSEAFLTDAHGRDHVTKIELACEKDGTFIAFRTATMANVGAYLSNFCDRDADVFAWHADGGAVQGAQCLCEREDGVHQHGPGRCVPGGRAARGHVQFGAGDRQDVPRIGAGPVRGAQAQLHHARHVPLYHAGGPGL